MFESPLNWRIDFDETVDVDSDPAKTQIVHKLKAKGVEIDVVQLEKCLKDSESFYKQGYADGILEMREQLKSLEERIREIAFVLKQMHEKASSDVEKLP